jgi:serine/threonine protein phosphatase PrpC
MSLASFPESAESTQSKPGQGGLEVGLASDPGQVLDHNEDASLAWQYMLAHQGQPPLPVGLFIIADGMGGYQQGAQASALAIRQAAAYVIRHVCLPLLTDDGSTAERPPINEILEASVYVAHEAVYRRLPEAGTTMTIALVLADSVYIAHVGDSRAYLGERGHLQSLTHDHSVAARLVDMGQAAPADVASQRHLLYKAIGRGDQIEPDMVYHDLDSHQYLLLCCDGLWNMLSDEEMAGIIESAATPTAACHQLVAQANKGGGDDNISVILAAKTWPLPPGPYH